ncbi:hypothetical protein RhiirA5_453482 [Rhizophagus irregularis]|uniref:Uncharacterized protein n=1 Tax=Rhizophagus irregularis TaxID=588596 RepID=A0A2N0P712_9GLOM|nr:hypothetical protein RhiirA5_453482 [Rhizophagus irregularis]
MSINSLLECIKNILTVPDITQNFALSYENYEYNRESIYSEQNTGKWWKTTQESLPTGSKLLSIILYSDATTTDTLGKSQLHPISIAAHATIWFETVVHDRVIVMMEMVVHDRAVLIEVAVMVKVIVMMEMAVHAPEVIYPGYFMSNLHPFSLKSEIPWELQLKLKDEK